MALNTSKCNHLTPLPFKGLTLLTGLHVCFVCRLSRGRTVIFSLHQPRFTIFKLIDRLSLLAAGHSVFHGPASQALPFFESLGLLHYMVLSCIAMKSAVYARHSVCLFVCPSVKCSLHRNNSTYPETVHFVDCGRSTLQTLFCSARCKYSDEISAEDK